MSVKRRQQLDARLARLFDRLAECEAGDAAGALAWTIRHGRELLEHGEPRIALEDVCSNLGEEGAIVALAPGLYEEIEALGRAYGMAARDYDFLRSLVRTSIV